MPARIAVCAFVIISLFQASCAHVVPRGQAQGRVVGLPNPRVHFPFDKDEVFSKDLALVDENAEWLEKNSGAVIILEGHADEHGGGGYNIELGDRRARTVKARLIERGVSHDRIIMVVSMGETKPLAAGHSFEAWQVNRRVEFIIR